MLGLLTWCQSWVEAGGAGGRTSSSFGMAEIFHPLPGTIIAAHCTWEVKLDTVFNRIPQTITEIICRNPNGRCGDNDNYNCRQIRSVLLHFLNDLERQCVVPKTVR